MQRLFLVGGLIAAFGFGVLAGGVLPLARAEEKPVALTEVETAPDILVNRQPVVPYYLNEPLVRQRWQIMTIPVTGADGPIVILLDTERGASYLLRRQTQAPAGYAWYLLDLR